MRNKRILWVAAALAMGLSCKVQGQTALTVSEMNSLATPAAGSVVSIHDPSVVFRKGTYYIWGSHLGVASSKDLVTYNPLTASSQTFAKPDGTRCDFKTAFNEQVVKQTKDYRGQLVDMPQVDAEAWCSWYAENKETWINGNMWAPDIIYNETMKRWCMYLSLNGDRWASVIILLTSPSATGPFTYQGPVVMGGFNGENGAPSYKNSDMHLALGSLSSLPPRYNQQGKWGTYWPNCIDPCVFFDEEGELWMTYGSWSGGIFMLRLDKETGLRDYTYQYTSDYDSKGANGVSDPYFGKKIAGGYYVSGEGSYIQHIGQYYYLFMSYGGFAPGGYDADGNIQGGYEMRIFRSKNPDGPYVDAAGKSALFADRWVLNFGKGATDNRGLRLMAAYNQWGNQTVGERSQGHNSACQDDKGRSFVVYHTKFNDGTLGHQVRTHQLFLNEKDWLVCAPFCYRGEETTDSAIAHTPISVDEIVGNYHFMLLPYAQNQGEYEEVVPTEVTLNANGSVTGAQTGTWKLTDGTSYLALKLGNTTYYGVFVEQEVNGATQQNYQTTPLKALAFTAVASNGTPVWGYKLRPKHAVAYNYTNNTINVKSGATYSKNISLMFPTTDNTVLKWTSSEPDVISETGKYNPRDEVTPVTLTVNLSCGEYFWQQSYDVKAQKNTTPSGDYRTDLKAYYNMDVLPCYNAYNEAQHTYHNAAGAGTKPVLESDYDRFGMVLHQFFGSQANCSYTRMNNPLNGIDSLAGFSVSLWVKRSDANQWDALWGFFNSTSSTAKGARFFLTGNSYLGYNANDTTWFDINHPDKGTFSDIPVGEWTFVTFTAGPENGIRLYVNGTNKSPHAVASSKGVTKVKELPCAELIDCVRKLKYFYLGLGSFWGSADCYIDDVLIHSRELSATDVRALNTMANRVTDFTKNGDETDVFPVFIETQPQQRGIFDLLGRRVSKPSRGLYIINGKKALVK